MLLQGEEAFVGWGWTNTAGENGPMASLATPEFIAMHVLTRVHVHVHVQHIRAHVGCLSTLKGFVAVQRRPSLLPSVGNVPYLTLSSLHSPRLVLGMRADGRHWNSAKSSR